MRLDDSDGFWSWYKSAFVNVFVGLGLFALLLWGAVIVVNIIGLLF